ncbi:MAG: hypothetical protein ACRDFX_09120 [Chloroflexota bacterium]
MAPWNGLALQAIGFLAAESYALVQGWRSRRWVLLLHLPVISAGTGLFVAGELYLPHGVKVALLILFFIAAIAALPVMILLAMYRSSKIRPPPGTVWTPPPGQRELPSLKAALPFAKLVVYLAFLMVPFAYTSLRIAITNWSADFVTVLAVASVWLAVKMLERRARAKK